jgi:anti-sigma B factor antagonist
MDGGFAAALEGRGTALACMTTASEPFRCDVLPAGDARVVLRPVGELDLATAPEVDRQLERLRAAGCTELVLDLRAVPFMDSSGLRVVLRWNELAAKNGCVFTLIRGPELVQRVFQATRVADALRFTEA